MTTQPSHPEHTLLEEVSELRRRATTRSFPQPALTDPLFYRASGIFIAAAGTIFFAASVAPLLDPATRLPIHALPVIAGVHWAFLILALWKVKRLPLGQAFDQCLLTMVAGEAVLGLAAVINYSFASALVETNLVLAWNGLAILIANLVMGAILAGRLHMVGIPRYRTWMCWLVVLNGIATVLTLLFLLP